MDISFKRQSRFQNPPLKSSTRTQTRVPVWKSPFDFEGGGHKVDKYGNVPTPGFTFCDKIFNVYFRDKINFGKIWNLAGPSKIILDDFNPYAFINVKLATSKSHFFSLFRVIFLIFFLQN